MNKIYILLFVITASLYGDLSHVFNNPLNWPPILYALHIGDDESAAKLIELYPKDLDRTTKTLGGFSDNFTNGFPSYSYNAGVTPLEMALRKGKTDLFKMMVDKGADLNFKRATMPESFPGNGKLHTALSIALEENNWEIIRFLRERGYNFNLCFATTVATKDLSNHMSIIPHWNNVFEMSSVEQLPFILEILSDKEASQEAIDWFKHPNPLQRAFEEGNIEMAVLALECGCDPYAEYPKNLMTIALEMDDPAFLNLLIDHKLFLREIYAKAINEHRDDLISLLFSQGYVEGVLLDAVLAGDFEMVVLLVEQGFKDEEALTLALEIKKYSIALFLYEQKFPFHPEYHKIGRYVDPETKKFLIRNDFPVWIGHNDIISAIEVHDLELLKLYYEKGLQLKEYYWGFYTAVRQNDPDILEFFFEKHSLSKDAIDSLIREALWIRADKRIIETLSKAY